MKKTENFLFFFYFSLVFSFFSNAKPERQIDWKLYKAKFHKTYTSEQAEKEANRNYLTNLKDAARASLKSSDRGAFFGINQFSDIDYPHFVKSYTGYKPSTHINKAQISQKSQTSQIETHSLSLNIKYVDWNETLSMLPPRFQGNCGSCWAFSSAAALEAYYVITTGGPYRYFSVQQIVDCCTMDCFGCAGGSIYAAFETITKYRINYDHYYPYIATEETCHPNMTSFRSAFRIHSFKWARPLDEFDVISALQKQPLAVAVHASKAWMMYGGGVIQRNQCSDDIKDLNHAVLLVGYTEEYWLVRNSWGTKWGEKGHIRLARGNTCGILHDVSWPSMDSFDENSDF